MSGVQTSTVFLLLLGLATSQTPDVTTQAEPSGPRDILYEELSTGLANFTVVDIRQRDAVIETGQIPGSHVLPLDELEQSLALSEDEFLARYGFPKLSLNDETLVLTCRTADKVQEANTILVANGFTKQRLYLGSYDDWVENGGDLIKPGKPFSHISTTTESAPSDSATANSTIPKEFIIF